MTTTHSPRCTPSQRFYLAVGMGLAFISSGAVSPVLSASAAAPVQVAAADPGSSSHLSTEGSLRNMKNTAHRVRIAALDVINDVEQTKLAVDPGDPRFIDPITYKEENSKVMEDETKELGALEAPNKKWLDADVSHLGSWITLLQNGFDNTALSPDQQAQVKAPWSEMAGVLQDVQTNYKKLQELTKGPKFDNVSIGAAALAIHHDMRKLENPWKQVLSTVRK